MTLETKPHETKTRTYSWQSAEADPELAMELSGLELLRRMFLGGLPGPSINATMDFTPETIDEGHVVFAGQPGEHFLNPMGGIHGGYGAALLDSVMGCAVHTMLPAGMSYGTVELKINYVRPMTPQTGEVVADGRIIHAGRRMATAEGKLIGRADGKLYAHGSTTCMIFPLNGA